MVWHDAMQAVMNEIVWHDVMQAVMKWRSMM